MSLETQDTSVIEMIATLGLLRVVHFTPAKNLYHILSDGQISSNKVLAEDSPEYFEPTDPNRLDDHSDMTCVTFSYPNPFYFESARNLQKFKLFSDWVCLFIRPEVLTRDGVLFCECNAATNGGSLLQPGALGLKRCFADTVGRFRRGPSHDPRAATNLQAEALIPGPIALSEIKAIAAPTFEAVGNERARLLSCDLDPDQFEWVVSENLFTKWPLANAIQSGKAVRELHWVTGDGEL